MGHVRGSLTAVVLAGLLSCSEDPPLESDASIGGAGASDDDSEDDDGKGDQDDSAQDAGAKKDASSGKLDAGTTGPDKTTERPHDAGTSRDVATLPPAKCGEQNFRTESTVPDMLIVLDRSSSMRPDAIRADLRCDDDADIFAGFECALAGIDCMSMQWMDTTFCGGTRMAGPVDRWTPSVTAITELTRSYEANVAFGLMTFPAGNGECNPGRVDVELDTGKAAQIAQVLDTTSPGGGTPTGETLQGALEHFQAMSTVGDQRLASAQYVLLVTDGQPTCPAAGARATDPDLLAQDKQLTLDALDALSAAGIKTFVVGYDAELDPQFADALTEFAEHGGTEHYYPVIDQASLVTAFQSVTSTVISCDFTFDTPVEDPSYLLVKLDDKPLKPDDPNGWSFANNTVTVTGEACATLQQGRGHHVEVTLECVPPIIM